MSAWLAARVEVSRRTLVLLLGDIVMIALFVSVGEWHHGRPLSAGLDTLGQFVSGWLLVMVPAGIYASDAFVTPKRAALHGFATWIAAAVITSLIRLLVTPAMTVQPIFVLVSIAIGGLFIGLWRFTAAMVGR